MPVSCRRGATRPRRRQQCTPMPKHAHAQKSRPPPPNSDCAARSSPLEYLSPGYSKKDRIARQMIEDAIASFRGAAAGAASVIGLFVGQPAPPRSVCAALGHPFVAVMSEGNPDRARQMMRAAPRWCWCRSVRVRRPDRCQARTSRLCLRRRSASSPRAAPSAPINLSWTETSALTSFTRVPMPADRGTGLKIDAFVDFVGLAAPGPASPPHCARTTPLFAATASSQQEPPSSPAATRRCSSRTPSRAAATAWPTRSPPDVAARRVYSGVERRGAFQTARGRENRKASSAVSRAAPTCMAAHLLRGEHKGGVVVCVICDLSAPQPVDRPPPGLTPPQTRSAHEAWQGPTAAADVNGERGHAELERGGRRRRAAVVLRRIAPERVARIGAVAEHAPEGIQVGGGHRVVLCDLSRPAQPVVGRGVVLRGHVEHSAIVVHVEGARRRHRVAQVRRRGGCGAGSVVDGAAGDLAELSEPPYAERTESRRAASAAEVASSAARDK